MVEKDDTQQYRDVLKSSPKPTIKAADLLSTGSTLLNLACSGRVKGGLAKGKYYYLVGDSSSGKTFLFLTCLAEACQNKNFDGYQLIFDNAEDGALMDWEKFFGKKAAERIQPPRIINGEPAFSSTVEELWDNVNASLKKGPCIYILDSMDSLDAEDDIKKTAKQRSVRNRRKAGKEVEESSGSYGTAKAKANSKGFREAMPLLRKTGSILGFISQTRDRIGIGAQYDPRTRSGGRALTFYATLEMWSSKAGHITKEVRGKKRELGIFSQVVVKKNRMQGKTSRKVIIPIYHSYGIDDIGSCVDYLISEGHWKKVSSRVTAKEFNLEKVRVSDIIKHIDENDLHRELQLLVAEVWNRIEKACEIQRKKRYD